MLGMSAFVVSEIEVQLREACWLEFELAYDHHRRQAKTKRKTGGKLFRQKFWRWMVELDNMVNMTPFAFWRLKRFQVPKDWEQHQGKDCLGWHLVNVSCSNNILATSAHNIDGDQLS